MNLATLSSRRPLIILGIATAAMFVVAIPTGSHHHGFVNVLSNVTWYAGLIGILLLIVLGVIALIQSRRTKSARVA